MANAQIAKFRGANMGPNWDLPVPDGPNVDPINLPFRLHTQPNTPPQYIRTPTQDHHSPQEK